jgi:hypothetical protein
MVIKDQIFEKIAESVKPDSKKRVYLHSIQIQEGISYHIYANKLGQIVLDPQVTFPASELWVFDNKDILAAIDRGVAESASGQLIDRGSFAKYVKKNAT